MASRKENDSREEIGNKKFALEIKIPPDDIGNAVGSDRTPIGVDDDVGNSIYGEPSHVRSGIISSLAEKDRAVSRNRGQRVGARAYINKLHGGDALRTAPTAHADTRVERLSPLSDLGPISAASVSERFCRLLKDRSGLPFSFSMRPLGEGSLDPKAEADGLKSLRSIIEESLKAASIKASVSLSKYLATEHRYAVFFICPAERDPVKNKEMISALRKAIDPYAATVLSERINLFLLLANAKRVIEEHLCKMGAREMKE